jgi:hypothetical protein
MLPIPNGDPFASIEKVLLLEAEIRDTGSIATTAAYEELPTYWRELVRLLAAFGASRRGHVAIVEEISNELNDTEYRPFVAGLSVTDLGARSSSAPESKSDSTNSRGA